MASTYFLTVQDEFVRLRGTPFLLASTDFEITRSWHEAGIPVEVVVDAMRDVLEGREPEARKVRGLRFVDRAVWKAWHQLGGGAPSGHRTAPDKLPALVAALRRANLADCGRIADEVAAVQGTVAEQEASLQRLDEELLAAARAELGDNWLTSSRRRATKALHALRPRLIADQWNAEVEAWIDDAAREVLQLPRLSLFG